jgi:DNA-binding beta-propeller fold protein YncE
MLVTDTNLNNIYQVSLINGNTLSFFTSRPDGTYPVAVAYDPTTYDVYYTDNGLLTRSISKYSLTSRNFITVYEDVNG